jgi:hypothetical protein
VCTSHWKALVRRMLRKESRESKLAHGDQLF